MVEEAKIIRPDVVETAVEENAVNGKPPLPEPQAVPVEYSSPFTLNCAQPAVEVEMANVPVLLEPTESCFHGEVLPMPVFTAKLMMSLPDPMVRVPPLAVSIVPLFWKTRLGDELVSPMYTSAPAAPIDTDSLPAVVLMANNGEAVVEVASVQANGVLLGMVEVELAVY